MFKTSRLGMNDTPQDMVVKMSESNPGAIACIVDILKKANEIDPQDALSPLGAILHLDDAGIYGSPIYIIWSDKCGRDTRKMLMLLRAVQLGLFPTSRLREMANDQMREVNLTEEEFDELDKKVCERLVGFQKQTVGQESQ